MSLSTLPWMSIWNKQPVYAAEIWGTISHICNKVASFIKANLIWKIKDCDINSLSEALIFLKNNADLKQIPKNIHIEMLEYLWLKFHRSPNFNIAELKAFFQDYIPEITTRPNGNNPPKGISRELWLALK